MPFSKLCEEIGGMEEKTGEVDSLIRTCADISSPKAIGSVV